MRLLINGAAGKMGLHVIKAAQKSGHFDHIIGVDKYAHQVKLDIPVYVSISDIPTYEKFDCIIDFSTKEALYDILPYALKTKTPIVIATTGFDQNDEKNIEKASKSIPIFKSGNMSIGINTLISVIEKVAKTIGAISDIEIIEQHHNQKIDAPSGTALMLANAVKDNTKISSTVNGREGILGKRPKNELGIHAIRGGSIIGKHEVLFILDKEVLTFKHEAEDRAVFANGSVEAALFLSKQKPGLYNMKDMFK
ncbi:MAG: 4-hydroxy-tetrahydrodipicolinate reductase [Christensenellales bacterium]|jgi:4-hydroxy-tetrahydrodipicolinate reductase|nr:4-hydroxy-tetrahydrodipicolinate reductase [Clostridiales bacterium]